ncbi:hypothetical protein THAOC_00951 [Thalassiosira oceanica]|uniref:Uncharacterized protein n=1 Tax=Thalassiosira oceanica TaxID=159749 RepID=K0TJE2_THAOC|nr:hypothetical protein THAOC_00951 [Thalassiosira oceanica]|eukprot:EJK77229.1 hypothetical protein THAOC_00951 [Thalassiosira oceanica]
MQELARRPSESPRPSGSGQSGWPCPPSRHGGAGPGYAVLRGGGARVTTRGAIEKLPLRGRAVRRKGGLAALGRESAPRRVGTPRRDLESEGKGGISWQSGGLRGADENAVLPGRTDGRATARPDPVRSRRSTTPRARRRINAEGRECSGAAKSLRDGRRFDLGGGISPTMTFNNGFLAWFRRGCWSELEEAVLEHCSEVNSDEVFSTRVM